MAKIIFQKPTDQPTGRDRMLKSIRDGLSTSHYTDWYIVVAFAKVGPLLRLKEDIQAWRRAGKKIRAVIGIDEQGTSVEALKFALENFSEAHIAHVPGAFTPTFHPKIYAFHGSKHAVAFIGSNNLTVGGLETNFEAGLRLEMTLPGDQGEWDQVEACYKDAVSASLPLTSALIDQLAAAALVLGEAAQRAQRQRTPRSPATAVGSAPALPPFPPIKFVPPSPLPAPSQRSPRRSTHGGPPVSVPMTPISPATQALVIQIKPQHNGEIHLSKRAADQDQAFFGWPFTGLSVPKKRKQNAPYPQRVPDPVVDLRIFDRNGHELERLFPFNLNMIYYARNHEIRVTVPQRLVPSIPKDSILVMRLSDRCDYEMDIHVPGGPAYREYLARCNQTMPGGGRDTPRKFGWI